MQFTDLIDGSFLDRENPFNPGRQPALRARFDRANTLAYIAWTRTIMFVPGALSSAAVCRPFWRWLGIDVTDPVVRVMLAVIEWSPAIVAITGLSCLAVALVRRGALLRLSANQSPAP